MGIGIVVGVGVDVAVWGEADAAVWVRVGIAILVGVDVSNCVATVGDDSLLDEHAEIVKRIAVLMIQYLYIDFAPKYEFQENIMLFPCVLPTGWIVILSESR